MQGAISNPTRFIETHVVLLVIKLMAGYVADEAEVPGVTVSSQLQ